MACVLCMLRCRLAQTAACSYRDARSARLTRGFPTIRAKQTHHHNGTKTDRLFYRNGDATRQRLTCKSWCCVTRAEPVVPLEAGVWGVDQPLPRSDPNRAVSGCGGQRDFGCRGASFTHDEVWKRDAARPVRCPHFEFSITRSAGPTPPIASCAGCLNRCRKHHGTCRDYDDFEIYTFHIKFL